MEFNPVIGLLAERAATIDRWIDKTVMPPQTHYPCPTLFVMFFCMLSLDNWFLRLFSDPKASNVCLTKCRCARSGFGILLVGLYVSVTITSSPAAILQWDHTQGTEAAFQAKLLPISGRINKPSLTAPPTSPTPIENQSPANQRQKTDRSLVPGVLAGASLSSPTFTSPSYILPGQEGETLPAPLGSSLLQSKVNRRLPTTGSLQSNAQDKDNASPENGIVKLLKPLTLEPRRREVLTQRYSNGKVQIEREVALDDRGNYMNDGKWKMYHTDGELMGIGKFTNGQMTGLWRRVHHDRNHPWFASSEFQGFTFPLISTADFSDGQLDGTWVIKDRDERKIIELDYKNGRRDGDGRWFHPNGQKRRQLSFKSDLLHGRWQEWDDTGKQKREDWFRDGQRISKNISYFEPGRPETEQSFLEGKLELTETDDWWNAKLATYQPTGEMIQSGPVRAWYDNGQKHMAGYFKDGAKHGEFAWWHPNGNRKLICQFENGQRTGQWIWWHENGIKAAEGNYEDDLPIGEWLAWDTQGISTQSPIQGDGDGREILAKPILDGESGADQAEDETLEELPPQTAAGTFPLDLPPPRESTDGNNVTPSDNFTPSVEALELNGPITDNVSDVPESQAQEGSASEESTQDPPPKPANPAG